VPRWHIENIEQNGKGGVGYPDPALPAPLAPPGSVAGNGDVDAAAEQGRSLTGTFGFGGRVPGFAPAYYLIGRIGSTEMGYTGPANYGSAEVYQDQKDWAIGGRMYLPLSRRVRIMTQLSMGEIDEAATVERAGERPLFVDETRFALFIDAGIQFRLNNKFSLGLVGDIAYHPDDGDQLAARSAGVTKGDGDRFEGEFGRRRLGISTTFHF
jgi:hypothetical protein